MSGYFDGVQRQLVARADALYPPAPGGAASVSRRTDVLSALRVRVAVRDVVGVIGANPRSRRSVGRSVGAIAVGACGGLVAALIVSLGAGPAASDFTVARGKGRLVTIKAATPSSIPGVNRRLASLGIAVRVATVLPRCVAPVRPVGARYRTASPLTLDLASMPVAVRRLKGDGHGLFSVRLLPPTTPGQTLVLAAGASDADAYGQLVSGSAPACVRGPGHRPAVLSAPS